MSQTSYSDTMSVAFAGMLGDLGPSDIGTGIVEGATEVPFGIFLKKGTGDLQVAAPTAANSLLVGIAVHSHAHDNSAGGDLGTSGIKEKGTVDVLRKGRIWVTVEENVAAGDRPFVRFANGAVITTKGSIRKSQETVGGNATCIDASALGVFRSSASAGGVALLEIDMTNKP